VWPFFTVDRNALAWTRGSPAHFRSSAIARRGYCAACGTPLTFEAEGEATIDISLGTLDEPAALAPTSQYWKDERMPWFAALAALPSAGLGAKLPAEEIARRRPFQHPDHDTASWPPEGQSR
jgi:hypothetical protein